MITSKAAGLAVAVAAAAAALSVAVASPASAATTSNGCTVAPLKPIFVGFNSSGVKELDYRISVKCQPGRTVNIDQQVFEEDAFPNPDDFLKGRSLESAGETTLHTVLALPNGEIGNEEVFHRVRFSVTSNGVTSPVTAFEKSTVLSIAN